METIIITAQDYATQYDYNNNAIAYWSDKHTAWILHRKYIECNIITNGFAVAYKTKKDAASK